MTPPPGAPGSQDGTRSSRHTPETGPWNVQGKDSDGKHQAAKRRDDGEDGRRIGKLVVKKNLGATWAQNYAQEAHFWNGQMV
jgi:hypothetical protein